MGSAILGDSMDEKKIIYEIIISIWGIVKEYFFHKLSDDDTEKMFSQVKEETERFKQYGETYNLLFRGIWSAFVQYYERKNKSA